MHRLGMMHMYRMLEATIGTICTCSVNEDNVYVREWHRQNLEAITMEEKLPKTKKHMYGV